MSTSKAILCREVSKSFSLHPSFTIRSLFARKSRRKTEQLSVIQDLSLTVDQGECLGIYAPNGAGKSTLLKLISGILQPDTGSLNVNGEVSPLLELGVGFHDELTGKENVFVNGSMHGLGRANIQALYKEIVAFSELEEFMDVQLKYYSTGMRMRLAFAVASVVDADIYLFDEVFAVGDAAFQEKCLAKVQSLHAQGKTIVLVSHDMNTLERLVDRILEKDDDTWGTRVIKRS